MFVLLHGFAQTHRAWDPVRAALADDASVLTPDLSADESDLPLGCVLAGYSMGARVALRAALAAPARVSRLVLISATAGIEDPVAREQRRAADEDLADAIERDGIQAFADRWEHLPLWAGDPPSVTAAARADRLRQDPLVLAATLRSLGPGASKPLWGRLGELTMPVDVVVGERDKRYVDTGQRLVRMLPRATLHVLPGAGHSLPLEAPLAVAQILAGS